MLPAAIEEEELPGDSSQLQQQAHGGPRVQQQQLHSQPDGQEARDPHAPGHRLPLLPLLDSGVCSQRVAGFRPALGLPSHRRSHLLHPPAVLHLGLREPHHLLLHEQALPPGHAGHLHLLQLLQEEPRRGQRLGEIIWKRNSQGGSGQTESRAKGH